MKQNSFSRVQNNSTKRARTFVDSIEGEPETPQTHDWHRKEPNLEEIQKKPLIFQQIDTEYLIQEPIIKYTTSYIPGQKQANIRQYGVTEDGYSICAHIYGFMPYFYIQLPPNEGQEFIKELRDELNERQLSDMNDSNGIKVAILSIEPVQLQSIMQYNTKLETFLRINIALPTLVPTARKLLENWSNIYNFTTYESNIPFVLRYMVDRNISGGTWIKIEPNTYTICKKNEYTTRSQIELHISYKDIISCDTYDNKYANIVPLRVLSFDIECSGRRGHFPTPDKDSVIQIATCLSLSNSLDIPIYKSVHTLNTCSPINGAHIHSFDTEEELLNNWQQLFLELDPDIITGYNIINFDFPYLLERASILKINTFPYFGKLYSQPTRIRKTTFSSRAVGKQESKELNIEGRIQFDLLLALRRDYKLRSYTLNAVSAEFLKQQKEDVHYSIITDLQNGDQETRKRLAEYCLKDSILPLRLMKKLMFLVNYIEMARVTGVPINYLLNRGQSIKVYSQILRHSRYDNTIVPVLQRSSNDNKYEGATILEPKRGYYSDPIATLDFASLYPSIMMAHNLCYTTLTTSAVYQQLGDEYVTVTPTNDYFIKSNVRKGLLPRILEELLSARKNVKKQMKDETDPSVLAVLNGRQLALKLSANSVYGFTGAQIGQLPCIAISSSVTAYGRMMIEQTREYIEKTYTKSNNYEHDATVVYGDTDSVMIKFGVKTVDEAIKLGREASEIVSKIFVNPIRQEFEKIYWPFQLMNKKRYAGQYWTNTNTWDKIDTKGIETVRRDNCALVKNVVTDVLEAILIQRSPQKAIDIVKNVTSELLQDKIDLSLLVISKSLGKGANASDYISKQAHVELAERMRKRDPTSAPVVGDRVPYIIIRSEKNAPNYKKSEDPIWVLENNIPIDTTYYLENQQKQPQIRIFEPLFGSSEAAEKQLFEGDHTTKIKLSTSIKGGIIQYATKKYLCLGCKLPIEDKNMVFCQHCHDKEPYIYLQQIELKRKYEQDFSKLWSQCQRCQGSIHQEVLCTSRDCPIFYRRKKVQIELDQISHDFKRL